jgi:hypothetical protein
MHAHPSRKIVRSLNRRLPETKMNARFPRNRPPCSSHDGWTRVDQCVLAYGVYSVGVRKDFRRNRVRVRTNFRGNRVDALHIEMARRRISKRERSGIWRADLMADRQASRKIEGARRVAGQGRFRWNKGDDPGL